MNDELNTPMTEEQLRLATSRSLPGGAKLDAETASLRDGFLSLGSALEAAGGDFDEAALIAKLTAARTPGTDATALVAHGELQPVEPASRVPSAVQLTVLLVSAALAASAVFAFLRMTANQPAAVEIAKAPGKAVDRSLAPVVEKVNEAGPSYEVVGAWSDPLDDEIAVAQAEMNWLGSRRYGVDGSLSQVGQQLEALSLELVGESL